MLLTSTKNPVVQSAKALLTAKGRREQDAFLCDGEHMTGEALRACPEKVSALFVEDGQQERFAPLLALARQTECAVYEVSAAVLETISQVKTPQGIAAVCGLPKPCPLERQGQKLLLMENVQDPGNVGTVLRTAAALGTELVVLLGDCADPYNPKTVRAAMGALFRQRLWETDLSTLCAKLREWELPLCGAALRAESVDVKCVSLRRAAIAVGNEGRGLTDALLEKCDTKIILPMTPGSESLNAAVAASILMWEMWTQRG